MKKSLLINAGLLAAIVILGLVAWFKPSTRDTDVRISSLKPAEVNAVQITLGGGTPITLERDAAGWKIISPFAAGAESFVVQRMLELLEARASARYPATGLARYGLNEPPVRLRLGAQEFAFGAFNELSREQYVLSGDSIYLLPLRYAAALPKSALDLLSKKLFSAEEAPIAFDFGSFRVVQADGKWTLTMTSKNVPAAEAGPDDIHRWVDDWRLAAALSVRSATDRKPAGALQVTLKDCSHVVVKIIERGASNVIARSDQPYEYVLSAETARRLLMPPGTVKADPPAAEK